MSVEGKRLIYIGPADYGDCKPLRVEGICLTASLLPGTIVEEVATGLQTNANAATVFGQELLVADRDYLKFGTVDEVLPQNENMSAIKLRSGEFANVLVADGNNITARGVPLSLNGAGLLKIAVPATEQVLCYSDEVINVSGADALVRVRL